MKTGAELIAEERQRQIEKEGWTKEHDAQHKNDELANAAICYADPNIHYHYENRIMKHRIPNEFWPKQWDKRWFKPTDRIRDLVKAGALIAAEIDRLQNETEIDKPQNETEIDRPQNEKVVCPKCLKPVGDCQEYPFYHNRIRYICPHCKYDGDSAEFNTAYSWHPIHNVSKDS